MPDYSYLQNLSDAELAALKAQTQGEVATGTTAVVDAQNELATAQTEEATAQAQYDATVLGQNVPPTVSDETKVSTGAQYDVAEYIAVDIPVGLVPYTGNGDDGVGVIQDWSIPLELIFNSNLQIYTSGEKVDDSASILQTTNGAIPSSADGSLISNEVGVIIPDLFDTSIARGPDQTFTVRTSAKAPDQEFGVSVFAKPADQIYVVERGPAPPDQVFEVRSIETYGVSAAELPFIVSVFAKPADQVFEVISSAVPADQTFTVTRGPDTPDETFDVAIIQNYITTVGVAPPDQTFFVTLGNAPAPTPDQIFDVSIGGPDAPPIPTPDQTFSVTTGVPLPTFTFVTKVITEHDVIVQEAPFIVTVSAQPADQVFSITTGAKAFDQVFSVGVGPDIPDQTFEVKSIETKTVTAYEAPKFYSIQENNSPAYVVSGEGLTFAVEPNIGLYVGQLLNLTLNTPANALWIKDVQEDGAGADASTFGATVTRNGSISGKLTAQFFQPGTYYYQSEFDAGVFGQIDVFGTTPSAPDTTFTVTTGAPAPDQIFVVGLGAEIPDTTFTVKTGEVFDVVVGPSTPDQTFTVVVAAENPDQTFSVTVEEPVLSYTVTNSGSGDYLFTGEGLTNSPDPALTAVVGQEMRFTMNAAGHPFWIGDANLTGTGVSSASWADTLTNNGIASGGTIVVVFNTPGTYHYNCQFHGAMHGTITVS